MELYKISQNKNTGWDTYSDAIVCAESEQEAQMIHPSGNKGWDGVEREYGTWTDAKNVMVEHIGTVKDGMVKGVICSSFHAG